MPAVIVPKFSRAATCDLPMSATWSLSRGSLRNPKTMKTQVIKEREGVLSSYQYEVGDMVSIDQYVVGVPGRLYSGMARSPMTTSSPVVPSWSRGLPVLSTLETRFLSVLPRLS